jgi:hypothetical protein
LDRTKLIGGRSIDRPEELSTEPHTATAGEKPPVAIANHRRCPPRGEAPARRAPLHATAAVTIATNADTLPEEKHQCDEHHCMYHQQQSPFCSSSPIATKADPPLPQRRSTSAMSTSEFCSSSPLSNQPGAPSPRRSTGTTSTTACPSSGHHRQPTPDAGALGTAAAWVASAGSRALGGGRRLPSGSAIYQTI